MELSMTIAALFIAQTAALALIVNLTMRAYLTDANGRLTTMERA